MTRASVDLLTYNLSASSSMTEHSPLLPPSIKAQQAEDQTSAAMWWTIGCVYGATAVAVGAFGAHGLKRRIADPQRLANWSTAAQYQVSIIPTIGATIQDSRAFLTLAISTLRGAEIDGLTKTSLHS